MARFGVRSFISKVRRRLGIQVSPATYWNEKYATDEFIYTKTANRFIIEFCEPLNPGTAIDLAGGEGRNTVWLAQRGWTVENVDISKLGLRKCDEYAREAGVAGRVRTLLGSGADFKSTLAPADLGIIPYLQVERPLLDQSIRNLVSQLKPGAHLVGVWHSLDNLNGGFGGPQDPKVLPSVASLREICSKLPLEVEVCENRDGQVQTKDGLKPSITVVLKARVLSE